MLFEENSEKEKKEPHGNCQKTSRIKNHNKTQKKIKPKPNWRQIRKIINKFRERKKVIQTANKFEKTKSKQTTVALLLNFIEEVILICLRLRLKTARE